MRKFLEHLGVGALGVVGVALLFVTLFAIGTAITAFFVWLIWNVLNLHDVFSARELSFWHVVAVAAAINIFSNNSTTTVKN